MDESNIIKKVTDYIEAHLGEDLPLDKIAEHLNYSKYHIARTFARETGSTVYKYIQGRRLTLAARKLVETEVPIIDIAGGSTLWFPAGIDPGFSAPLSRYTPGL